MSTRRVQDSAAARGTIKRMLDEIDRNKDGKFDRDEVVELVMEKMEEAGKAARAQRTAGRMRRYVVGLVALVVVFMLTNMALTAAVAARRRNRFASRGGRRW